MVKLPKGIDPGFLFIVVFMSFLLYWFMPEIGGTAPAVVAPPPVPVKALRPAPEPPLPPPQVETPARTWVPFAAPPAAPAAPEVKEPPPAAPAHDKRSALPENGRPRVAIVIDDVGLSAKSTREAIELPAAITLSFLPYGDKAAVLAREAREAGHEIMLHVPMQPEGAEDPGPNVFSTAMRDEDIMARLDYALDVFPGIVGVNNHMGSRFTADGGKMAAVMRAMKRHRLFFLDSRTTPRSQALRAAQEQKVPALARDVFLDNDATPGDVARELAAAEVIARKHGSAIAIGHPHAVTLAALRDWAPSLGAKGLELVPITALLP